ncbi:MAG: hypothetical protein N2319_01695 [Candidatus Kapabacteria bacterium]|nr:hypothetical protein [Candidatus Kapabacteria bacterium]
MKLLGIKVFGTPNTEHRTPNTEHRTPNTEHRTPNTGLVIAIWFTLKK